MTKQHKEPDLKHDSVKRIITYWASKGLSQKSIAAKCNITFEELTQLLNYEVKGIKPLQLIYDAARADYEATRLEIRDEILFDPETSKGLKAKILRDDLKEFEEHAPATRAIRIQAEDVATVFSFEALSEEEQETIKSAYQSAADNDQEEDSPSAD